MKHIKGILLSLMALNFIGCNDNMTTVTNDTVESESNDTVESESNDTVESESNDTVESESNDRVVSEFNDTVESESIAVAKVMYENAEDGDIEGWSVDKSPTKEATIVNSYDSEKSSRVIKFNSSVIYDSYRFMFASEDTKNSVLKWSMKYNTKLYGFNVFVQTIKGQRILMYKPTDTGDGMLNGTTIIHGLGSHADNGEWHTHIRDLSVDLKRYENDNEIVSVQGLMLYGSGSIDDIALYEKSEGLDVTIPVEVTAPGIVLTFDDTIIDDWYAMRDTFKQKGVVATFFCYKWATLSVENVRKFRQLESDGHEIGFHTVDHLSTYDVSYNDVEDKAQSYFDEQIIPGLNAMRIDNFEPTSFSYPYMSGQPKHNELIRKELPHIREFFSSVVQMDKAAKNSVEDIKKELLRLKNNKDIGVFLSHYIPEKPIKNPYHILQSDLIEIIDEANRLGLKFYTLEEAHRIYMHQ